MNEPCPLIEKNCRGYKIAKEKRDSIPNMIQDCETFGNRYKQCPWNEDSEQHEKMKKITDDWIKGM